jgi:hypothetical protein
MGQKSTAWVKNYTFLYGKGNENHLLGTEFVVCQRITAAKSTAGDTMSCIALMLLAILYCMYKWGMASIVHAQNMDRW